KIVLCVLGCYGFWCGPCLACTVSGRMKELYCLPLFPPVVYGMRVAMRNRYKIKGSLLNDLFASWCCAWCSWCQMHRELKLHGLGPNRRLVLS
uniref:Cornifelin n=1 Tax=Neogobius melanostomus TaxID=47308 RepID=A0A8C6UC20_9GOBI